MSSYSRQSSTSSSVSAAGTSSFQVGRERQRQPEMELFSHGRKPRSNYRRPSSLGLANTPLPDQTEAKGKFTPLAGDRSHIVAPLKDHLKPEGNFEKTSEVQACYRNLSPSRPVIHKLKDTLKPQGDFANAKDSEVHSCYRDFSPSRPVIHKLKDTLKPQGDFANAKDSEVHSAYRDFSPSRPVIHKLKDTLEPQGDFATASETVVAYKDNHATRPICHKLKDHGVDVQPEGNISKTSEYNTNFAKSMKGERAPPAWLSDFEKVTIEWISYHCRANSRRRRHITLSSPKRKSKNYYSTLH